MEFRVVGFNFVRFGKIYQLQEKTLVVGTLSERKERFWRKFSDIGLSKTSTPRQRVLSGMEFYPNCI